MQPPPGADADLPLPRDTSPLGRCWLLILWPAFVMAGVLEALVFVIVDPASLRAHDGSSLSLPAIAIHTIAFITFWIVVATASAITQFLARPVRD